ncbi:MAG TPA: ComF family protein [Leucothrix mucor]|nr:ComF family protein [Leucothrix mucor]
MRLFTPSCVLCDANAGVVSLCDACLHDLPKIQHSCRQCGLPFPDKVETALCGQCQQSPPAIDYLISSLHYGYPVDYLVAQLKFNRNLSYAKILSHLLLNTLQSQQIETPDVIIPVPLHKKRLRKRGFNQALEIARPIAKALDVPIAKQHLERVKQTQAQSLLNAVKRKQNLRHSFKLVKSISVKHVVIIDDVVTTGATVFELADLLKKSGVEKVGVWAVARA